MRKRLEDYFPAYFRKMYEEQRKSGEISGNESAPGWVVTWVSQGKKYITPGQQPLGQRNLADFYPASVRTPCMRTKRK